MKLMLLFAILLPQTVAMLSPQISQKGCISDPADIVFVLDASSSIGIVNFNKELQFLAEFAQHYVIGPQNVQIGIITYSTNAQTEFAMNKYQNINDLENAITSIRYISGFTHTGTALHHVRMNSFTSKAGDRRWVNNYVVVITDGQSNDDVDNLQTEATILHTLTNTETFAIGVGNNIRQSELLVIASSQSHTLTVKDHLNLHLALKEIRCASPSVPTNAPTTALTTQWIPIGSGHVLVPSTKCKDSSLFTCTKAVCTTPTLQSFCPVTCGICLPCKDETIFNCNPAVCTDSSLTKFCPLTCGLCSGTPVVSTAAPTQWIHIPGK